VRKPEGLMQALREQSVMSTPIRVAAVEKSVRCNHLLSEEIDQQEWRVAFGAVATQTDGTAIEMALRATTLADEALTAVGAFVHGARHDRSATLELMAKLLQIGQLGAVTQAKRELLVGARAVACALRKQGLAAHQATTGTITRSLTHGRRHGWSSGTRCLGASLAR
jgi:hypothetical protein